MQSQSTKYNLSVIISCQLWTIAIIMMFLNHWEYVMPIVYLIGGIWAGYTGFKFVQNLALQNAPKPNDADTGDSDTNSTAGEGATK
jgi:hypothetical protein